MKTFNTRLYVLSQLADMKYCIRTNNIFAVNEIALNTIASLNSWVKECEGLTENEIHDLGCSVEPEWMDGRAEYIIARPGRAIGNTSKIFYATDEMVGKRIDVTCHIEDALKFSSIEDAKQYLAAHEPNATDYIIKEVE